MNPDDLQAQLHRLAEQNARTHELLDQAITIGVILIVATAFVVYKLW